jgi:hypothetical protein
VQGGDIIVTLPKSMFKAVYYKAAGQPQLILRRVDLHKRLGWVMRSGASAHGQRVHDSVAGSNADIDPWPPGYTDEALTLRFAELHSGNLRYVDERGQEDRG